MEADVVIIIKVLWKVGYMFALPVLVPGFILGKLLRLI